MTATEATRFLTSSPRGRHALRELEQFLPLMESLTADQSAAVVELVRRMANGHHRNTLESVQTALEPK